MTTQPQASREYATEQIMELYGRYQPNPKSYRDHLNKLTLEELNAILKELVE